MTFQTLKKNSGRNVQAISLVANLLNSELITIVFFTTSLLYQPLCGEKSLI